jgi:hypothetical protein
VRRHRHVAPAAWTASAATGAGRCRRVGAWERSRGVCRPGGVSIASLSSCPISVVRPSNEAAGLLPETCGAHGAEKPRAPAPPPPRSAAGQMT